MALGVLGPTAQGSDVILRDFDAILMAKQVLKELFLEARRVGA